MSKNIEITVKIPLDMDSETAKHQLGEAIYKTAIHFYETIGEHGRLTDKKSLRGNGHHKAQKLAQNARKIWSESISE